MKKYAVVLWFNPAREHAANILSYADVVDRVLVIDNSNADNSRLLPDHPGVQYRPQFANRGIGRALNQGFEEARRNEAAWVLTMDQDSSFARGDIARLMQCASDGPDSDVAIFGPTLSQETVSQTRDLCDSAITSGSLIRVAAHSAIGGYNEALFVDDVDHEFGYRLRRGGFRILRVNSVFLSHRIGEPLSRKVLWRTIHTTNHNAVRKYYMTRNRLYMRKHYPEFGAPYLRMVLLDALKVVLVEEDKARKLRLMAKGAIDFCRGAMGELR
jgi:rhamnosyltransferase